MKKTLYLLVFFTPFVAFTQAKTCDDPKEQSFEDLSAIVSTKCSFKPSESKKAQQISVTISANKTRFLKRRSLKKVSSNSVGTNGLGGLDVSSNLKNQTVSVLNTLSIEEVKKCDRFVDVDEIPAFEKCSTSTGDARVDCFNQEMVKHIEKYFNYPDQAIVKKIEGEVWVRFIIDEDGNIANIKAHAPKTKEILEQEALRVVSYLPKFTPATKKGKNVSVKYGFPINFSLSE